MNCDLILSVLYVYVYVLLLFFSCNTNDNSYIMKADVYFKDYSILTPVSISPDQFREYGEKCAILDSVFLNEYLLTEIHDMKISDDDNIGEPDILVDLYLDNGITQEFILNPFVFKYLNNYYEPELDIMNEIYLVCKTGKSFFKSDDGVIRLRVDSNE